MTLARLTDETAHHRASNDGAAILLLATALSQSFFCLWSSKLAGIAAESEDEATKHHDSIRVMVSSNSKDELSNGENDSEKNKTNSKTVQKRHSIRYKKY